MRRWIKARREDILSRALGRGGVVKALVASSLCLSAVFATEVDDPKPMPWPKEFDHSAKRVEAIVEPPGDGREDYHYSGPRFQVVSAEKLGSADVAAMFVVLESIEPAMRALPLPLLSSHPRRRPYRVRVFSTEQQYLDNGGAPGSVGMYSSRHRATLMLHASLFGHTTRSKPRPSVALEDRYDVLVHEVTHQLMARWASVLPPWYFEGHAEYLAVAHDRPGHFQFQNMERAITKHIKKFVLRRREPVTVPPIARLLGMSSGQWLRDNRRESDETYHKYAGALILTHYYYQLDSPNGDAIRAFLLALREGDSPARATKTHLVGDRDMRQIEKKLVDYWRHHGLELAFAEA